jgi:hypothetical protein
VTVIAGAASSLVTEVAPALLVPAALEVVAAEDVPALEEVVEVAGLLHPAKTARASIDIDITNNDFFMNFIPP